MFIFTISLPIIIAAILPRLYTYIPFTYSTCCFSVVNAAHETKFIILSAVSTSCSSQISYMVYLLHSSILAVPSIILLKPENEFCLSYLFNIRMAFAALMAVSVYNAINSSCTQTLNTINPNEFSHKTLALDRHYIQSKFRFANDHTIEHKFKMLLMRSRATWATQLQQPNNGNTFIVLLWISIYKIPLRHSIFKFCTINIRKFFPYPH
jgi:hypothetical protein